MPALVDSFNQYRYPLRLLPDVSAVTSETLAQWNDDLDIREGHNCYAFGIAALGLGWLKLKNTSVPHDASRLMDSLYDEGFVPIRAHSGDYKSQHILVAYVRHDGEDFHFARSDTTGHWFEKMAFTKVTAGRTWDQLQKDMTIGNYYFVGCFVYPENGIVFDRHPCVKHNFFHPDETPGHVAYTKRAIFTPIPKW